MNERTLIRNVMLVALLVLVPVACGDSGPTVEQDQTPAAEEVVQPEVEVEVPEVELPEEISNLMVLEPLEHRSGALELAREAPRHGAGNPEAPAYVAAGELQVVRLANYLNSAQIISLGLIFANDTGDNFQIVVSGRSPTAVNRYIGQAQLTLDVNPAYFQPQYLPVEPVLPLGEMIINALAEQTGMAPEEVADAYGELTAEVGAENASVAMLAEKLGADTLSLGFAAEEMAVNHYLSGPGNKTTLFDIAYEPGLNFIARQQRPGDFVLLEELQEMTGLTIAELNEVRAEIIVNVGEEGATLETLAEILGFDVDELLEKAQSRAFEFTNQEARYSPRINPDLTLELQSGTPTQKYLLIHTLRESGRSLPEHELAVVPRSADPIADLNAAIGIPESVPVDILSYGFSLPTEDTSLEASIDTLIHKPGQLATSDIVSGAVYTDLDYVARLVDNPEDLLITFEWLHELNDSDNTAVEPAWFDVDPSIDDGVTHYYRARCQMSASATLSTSQGQAALNMWRRTVEGFFMGGSQTTSAGAGGLQTLWDNVSPDVIQFDINVRGERDDSVYRIFGYWTRGFGDDC